MPGTQFISKEEMNTAYRKSEEREKIGRNDPMCTVVANRSYTHLVHVEGGRKRREPEGDSYYSSTADINTFHPNSNTTLDPIY